MSENLSISEETNITLIQQNTFLTPEFLMNKMIEGRRIDINTQLSKISDEIIKEAQNGKNYLVIYDLPQFITLKMIQYAFPNLKVYYNTCEDIVIKWTESKL